MRAGLISAALLLGVGACERDAPVPTRNQITASEDKSIAARLADELVALAPEHVLALPDLGWLQMKRYRAYDGRNPRTGESVAVPEAWIPFWYPTAGHWDRQLVNAMNVGINNHARLRIDSFPRS
jgi:nucleoid DNA-binding protein